MRGWRRLAVVAAAAAVLSGTGAPTASRATETRAATATAGWRDLGPLISGTFSHVAGPLVWTDYAYDDRGANVDTALPGGDQAYPGAPLDNAADLIQVQFDVTGSGLSITMILETLVDAAAPLLGVMLDTDADPATGAAAVPGSAWAPRAPLGIDHALVISHGGATVSRFTGGAWHALGDVAVELSTEFNHVTLTVPAGLLPALRGTWHAFALAGLAADPWTEGGVVYDLAFVRDPTVANRNLNSAAQLAGLATGQTIFWQDHNQADVLAGRADPALARAAVDLDRIAAGDTELATLDAPGYHTPLYRSRLTLPEGVVRLANDSHYLGPYQPYLLQVPDLPPPLPLVFYLHGSGGNHQTNAQWFVRENDTQPVWSVPGFVVGPLARSHRTFGYAGIAEIDVLEVYDDALARLPVDPERVVLSGNSAGGIGTYRLGGLYPDRFSAAISHIGTASGPHSRELLENWLNLPLRSANGRFDPLIPASQFEQDMARSRQLRHDTHHVVVEDAHHNQSPHLSDCWYDLMTERRRSDPARVHYAVFPDMFQSDPEAGYDIRYDSAYWVSGIEVRAGAAKGVVDVTSLARADRRAAATIEEVTGTSALGRDFCGDNPSVLFPSGLGNIWTGFRVRHVPDPQPTGNGLAATLSGLAAVALDLSRMDLDPATALSLSVGGDGVTTLDLVGDWSGRTMVLSRVGGPSREFTPSGRHLRLDVDFTGAHDYVLEPAP